MSPMCTKLRAHIFHGYYTHSSSHWMKGEKKDEKLYGCEIKWVEWVRHIARPQNYKNNIL